MKRINQIRNFLYHQSQIRCYIIDKLNVSNGSSQFFENVI